MARVTPPRVTPDLVGMICCGTAVRVESPGSRVVASVRAKAVCVIRRGDDVLLIPGYDEVKRAGFFIPPGGGVEFGEHSADTVVREVMEELGVVVVEPVLLGIFENIFEYRGRAEHEVIFAYGARFADSGLLERDRFEGVESDHAPFVAEWVSLETFSTGENILFPEGLLALLRDGA